MLTLAKSSPRKVLAILTMVFVLGFGLRLFYQNQYWFLNFKPYHISAYLQGFSYRFSNLSKNGLALLAGAGFPGFFTETQAATRSAESIPVLLYHGVLAESDGANTSLSQFQKQLLALKGAGWRTVTLQDFYEFQQGAKRLPDKSFLLTFDDGRKDSYYPVDPLLDALDYSAVMFVITEYSLNPARSEIDSNYYLTITELQQMLKSGRWEIQPHAGLGHDFSEIGNGQTGHYFSNRLWLANSSRLETEKEFGSRVFADMETARQAVEQYLQVPVFAFAFPFGDYGQSSVNFPQAKEILPKIAQQIYKIAFYDPWPGDGNTFVYPDKNTFLIRRIVVEGNWTEEDLLNSVETGRVKSLPLANGLAENSGWLISWGNLEFSDSDMTLGANNTTSTGASVFLNGTRLWQNYSLQTQFEASPNNSVSVMARYQNDRNFVACTLTGNTLLIEQWVNGSRTMLAQQDLPSRQTQTNVTLTIIGRYASCATKDAKVESNGLYSKLLSGGIGFKLWNPIPGKAQATIKQLNVRQI